jgi:hypothetical protein
MLDFRQAEAIRIAILKREEKMSPDDDLSVGVSRCIVGGKVWVVITRALKTSD